MSPSGEERRPSGGQGGDQEIQHPPYTNTSDTNAKQGVDGCTNENCPILDLQLPTHERCPECGHEPGLEDTDVW